LHAHSQIDGRILRDSNDNKFADKDKENQEELKDTIIYRMEQQQTF